MVETNEPETGLKIIGLGGTGCRAVTLLTRNGLGLNLIAADADWASVRAADAERKIEFRGGPAVGLGTDGLADWARQIAEACADDLRGAIAGAEVLLIVAGLGCGVGSGASPVVARIARELGIPTAALVTLPLKIEGSRLAKTAEEGRNALLHEVDALLILPLEAVLKETGGKITLSGFYTFADKALQDCLLSLAGKTDAAPGTLPANGLEVLRNPEGPRLPEWFGERLTRLEANK